MNEELLPLAKAARLGGTNSTKVRRLIKEGRLPYRLQDLATGELVPEGGAPPQRFQYMLPRRAVQEIANLAGRLQTPSQPPTSSPVSPAVEASRQGDPYFLQELSELRLRAEVAEAKLKAKEETEAALRAHIAELEGHVADLQRLLPPAPSEAALKASRQGDPFLQVEEVPQKHGFWRRLFGRQT